VHGDKETIQRLVEIVMRRVRADAGDSTARAADQ